MKEETMKIESKGDDKLKKTPLIGGNLSQPNPKDD